MKRLNIFGASFSEVEDRIVTKFTNQGCTDVKITEKHSTYCEVSMTLPSGSPKKFKIWYNMNNVKNGVGDNYDVVPWDPNYTIDSDGNIVDKSGSIIGYVKVYIKNGTRQKTRNSYSLKSLGTDTGDVVLRDLKTDQDFKQAVTELESRQVKNNPKK